MLGPGTTLQGRYRVQRQLGQGGMGAVYEATDERFGTPVALKEIMFVTTDEQQRRYLAAAFEREAKALATIQHECIPFVRDYFSEEDREYLVMELVQGDDLGKVLEQQKKPFSLFEVLGWLQQLLDSLDYLHNLNPAIVHRDIKPQNLKVTGRNRLKLLDFGIAKSGERSAATTKKQTFIGATLDYSPFEQILRVIDASFREFIILKHEAKANRVLTQATDARADIFAAGATFYHLITGRVPEDATKRTLAVWEGNADPLPHPSDINGEIPRVVGDVLLRAMAVDHGDRFPNAAEMLDALNRAAVAPAPTAEIPASTMVLEEPAEVPQNAYAEIVPFYEGDTHAFTISSERALSEPDAAAGMTSPMNEDVPKETAIEQPAESVPPQSSVDTVPLAVPSPSTPAAVPLISSRQAAPPAEATQTSAAAPQAGSVRRSSVETVVLPASMGTRPTAQFAMGRWLGLAGGFLAVLIVFGGAAAIWFGGLIGGGGTPPANNSPAASQPASPPTLDGPAANVRADGAKTREPVSKPPPSAALVPKPKQKRQAGGQDLNCVYTNSCK